MYAEVKTARAAYDLGRRDYVLARYDLCDVKPYPPDPAYDNPYNPDDWRASWYSSGWHDADHHMSESGEGQRWRGADELEPGQGYVTDDGDSCYVLDHGGEILLLYMEPTRLVNASQEGDKSFLPTTDLLMIVPPEVEADDFDAYQERPTPPAAG